LDSIQSTTLLSRFVTSLKNVRKEKTPFAKPTNFLPRPNPDTGQLELSTFQVSDLGEEHIWELATLHIEPRTGRRVPARCDLPVSEYELHDLRADDDDDPPRHVNVVDWPANEEDQLAIANDLAIAVHKRGGLVFRFDVAG